MKTETFKGTVTEAYGKQLPAPVNFSGSFEAYESYEEVKSANAIPENDDILGFVNARRKASARAKATVEALDAAGYKKPDQNDPATIRANMVKMLMKLHSVDESTAAKILDAAESAAKAVA